MSVDNEMERLLCSLPLFGDSISPWYILFGDSISPSKSLFGDSTSYCKFFFGTRKNM